MKRIAIHAIPRLGRTALCALAFLAGAPSAWAERLVDVTVVNRQSSERLTPYRHEGKLYVVGTPGESYAVELRGLSGKRVLGVLSVDGINALTGQNAEALQSGYVLDGRQRYAINGWRKSLDEVAKFVFTDLPESYAARTGRPANVGVIGVAVFREKIEPPPPVAFQPAPSSSLRSAPESPASMADGAREGEANAAAEMPRAQAQRAPAEAPAKKLGTGHGEREYSPTRYTPFVRNQNQPDEVIVIYYDSRANLIARGIIPATRATEPQPFPGGAGFVPDPRG